MAIDTFANLKAKVRATGHRGDQPDSKIEDYIAQVESDLWQSLRIRTMDTRATATTNATRYIALPTDFIRMRNLVASDSTDHFPKFASPSALVIKSATGVPKFYTVTSQLEFDRVPSTLTLTMQYFKKLTALSDSNTTNDILTNFPNLYIFGCMQYLKQDAEEYQEAEFWNGKFDQEVAKVNKQDKRDGYGPAPASRNTGMTP